MLCLLGAALSMASLLSQPACAATSNAQLRVQVMVLPAARVQAYSATASVRLSEGNVRSRLLEVPGALTATIFTTQGNFALDLAITDPQVEKVEVTGLGRAVTVGAQGHRELLSNEARVSALDLSYVVTYRPGVEAGPRPMPVKATFDLL